MLLGFLAIPGLHDDAMCREYQVIEFFAGGARTSRLAKGLRLRSVALDRDFGASMDLNTPAGFLLLVSKGELSASVKFATCLGGVILSVSRLHCAILLQSSIRDAMLLMGICCSTYVAVNRGTSQRCPFLPLGSPSAVSVYRANKLTSRQGAGFALCARVCIQTQGRRAN